MQAVWLHDVSMTSWAFLHAVKRHGGRIQDIVSISVDVPDRVVRRASVPGLFYVLVDVAPDQLGSIMEFRMVAASPLEGGDA